MSPALESVHFCHYKIRFCRAANGDIAAAHENGQTIQIN